MTSLVVQTAPTRKLIDVDATPITITLPQSVGENNGIMVVVSGYNETITPQIVKTVSDSHNNNYLLTAMSPDGVGTARLEVFYAHQVVAGTTLVTVTPDLTSGNRLTIMVFEVSGAESPNPIEVITSNTLVGDSQLSQNSSVIAQTNMMALAVLGWKWTATKNVTANDFYETIGIEQSTSDGSMGLAALYTNVRNPSAQIVDWVFGAPSSGSFGALIVFKATPIDFNVRVPMDPEMATTTNIKYEIRRGASGDSRIFGAYVHHGAVGSISTDVNVQGKVELTVPVPSDVPLQLVENVSVAIQAEFQGESQTNHASCGFVELSITNGAPIRDVEAQAPPTTPAPGPAPAPTPGPTPAPTPGPTPSPAPGPAPASWAWNNDFYYDSAEFTAINGAEIAIVEGEFQVTNTTADFGQARVVLPVWPGQEYTLSFDSTQGTNAGIPTLHVGTHLLFNAYANGFDGSSALTFTATSSCLILLLNVESNAVGAWNKFDNFVLDRVSPALTNPNLVYNGEYASGTIGWQKFNTDHSIVAGSLRVTNVDTQFGSSYQQLCLPAGVPHELHWSPRISSNDNAAYIHVGNKSGYNVYADSITTTPILFTPTDEDVVIYLNAGGNVTGTYTDYPPVYVIDPATSSAPAPIAAPAPTPDVNLPPVAEGDVTVGIPYETVTVITVLNNDHDPDGDTLVIGTVNGSTMIPGGGNVALTHGTMALTLAGVLEYSPPDNFSGGVTFDYQAKDPEGLLSNTITVSLLVGEQPNQTPVVVSDNITVSGDLPFTFSPVSNDSDPDGDQLTLTKLDGFIGAVGQVFTYADGTVDILANNQLRFNRATDFVGTTSFSYTVADPDGAEATGTVNVTVTAPAAFAFTNVIMPTLPTVSNPLVITTKAQMDTYIATYTVPNNIYPSGPIHLIVAPNVNTSVVIDLRAETETITLPIKVLNCHSCYIFGVDFFQVHVPGGDVGTRASFIVGQGYVDNVNILPRNVGGSAFQCSHTHLLWIEGCHFDCNGYNMDVIVSNTVAGQTPEQANEYHQIGAFNSHFRGYTGSYAKNVADADGPAWGDAIHADWVQLQSESSGYNWVYAENITCGTGQEGLVATSLGYYPDRLKIFRYTVYIDERHIHPNPKVHLYVAPIGGNARYIEVDEVYLPYSQGWAGTVSFANENHWLHWFTGIGKNPNGVPFYFTSTDGNWGNSGNGGPGIPFGPGIVDTATIVPWGTAATKVMPLEGIHTWGGTIQPGLIYGTLPNPGTPSYAAIPEGKNWAPLEYVGNNGKYTKSITY